MKLIISAALTVVAWLVAPAPASQEPWPQWGGPRRDFTSHATGLAGSWPASGPRRIWSRPLGEGHSAISTDADRLYTLYRPIVPTGHAQEEVVAAIEMRTGATVWEHRFPSPTDGAAFGPYMGPHTTPLVAGGRVFAAGSRKQLFALDAATGRVLWTRHLINEFGAPEGDRGYAASPLLHDGRLVVSVGGTNQSIAAFDAATGAVLWKAGNLRHSPASPIVIEINGRAQIVYFGGDAVGGFDPATGRQLWKALHSTSSSLNISMPLWSAAERRLFISAGYGTGSRLLELFARADSVVPIERWYNHRVRVHFSNAVRVGPYIVGSSGDFGPMFLTAVRVDGGEIAWQDRTFARAQLLVADGKLIILDEDGTLALATVTAGGLHVHSRAPILESISWTPPTLVGTRLFVRDRKTIAAYDLGR